MNASSMASSVASSTNSTPGSMQSSRPDSKPDSKPWIVLVGGFLGSGKTTLILSAIRELERRGLHSVAIFNDQGKELVDTNYAELSNVHSGEVIGGCFCCKFSDLLDVIHELSAWAPDVIFAEPVGSCTDISATVLRPLEEDGERFRLAPITVLVDPARAEELQEADSEANMRFLFEKQLDEADIVCFTKSDLYPQLSSFDIGSMPLKARQISSKTGQGVAAWLDEALSGTIAAGGRSLAIDYAQYAKAEAALAWLNLQAVFEPEQPTSPAMTLGPFFDGLDRALTDGGIPIVHLKAIVTSPSGFVKAAICANGQEPVIEGNLDASPSRKLQLLLNLRAVGEPDRVRALVEQECVKLRDRITRLNLDCFCPSAPIPERRIAR
ncbi:MAG TPA: GTP-binding protein [Acidobacteriaceae bacterium]